MLERGLIVSFRSHVVSLILLVPKYDGFFLPCVNYKRLNALTEKDHYPMPLMLYIRKMVAGAKILSKLDLKDVLKRILVFPENQQ